MDTLNIMGPVICDIEGLTLSAQDKAILKHPLVGGLILFARNYENQKQLAALVSAIRALKPHCFISVDQEGGRVQRFINEFTRLPAVGSLGLMLDSGLFSQAQVLEYTEYLGYLMAKEIRAFDIDISFAPVVDCDKGISQIIGDRAFHHDPMTVAHLALAYIKGMGKAGMSATLKHFPGHGSVKPDSHLELPIDNRTIEEIKEDMLPFRYLIEQKLNNIQAIMPAHIIYSALDDKPAGFSSIILNDILRKEFGFTGTIISDDLSMKATNYLGDMSTRVNLALQAGCDNVLICNDRAGVEEVLDSIKDERSMVSKTRLQNLLMPVPQFCVS